jgi:pyruvate/2-oxoglutarate dehydrogenase complex dihydrolipoamide acyltransferase (E2) component
VEVRSAPVDASEAREVARIELHLPQHVENAMEPATVCTVYHGAGEPVRKGEPVLELINADRIFDLPAPVTGIIVEIVVRPGEMVKPGRPLLVMESGERAGEGRAAGDGKPGKRE